ncbi:MAG TPA: transglutaminase-like domain-containing protein [Thermoanaerobaculaceae bacterium]|nr:transglutaminase-like domain-containing protein [Thermoanaerobaculaceae bacterium]
MGGAAARARRWVIGGAIVAFWLAMTAVLLHREYGGRTIVAHRGGKVVLPRTGESWLGVLVGGRRIGTARLVTQREERHGVTGFMQRLDLRLAARVLNAPAELRVGAAMWRAVTVPQASFDLRIDSTGHALQAEGTVVDGLLDGVVRSAGERVPVRLQVGNLLGGSDDLFALLPSPVFSPGEEATFPGFDPLTLRPAQARARCLRAERLTLDGGPVDTRVVEVTIGKATVTAWLDGDGGVVQAQLPFGLTLRRLSRAEALSNRPAAEAPDLVAAFDVTPSGVRPRRDATRMVVRVEGVGPGDVPSDDTQAARGDTVVVSPSPGPLATPPQADVPPGRELTRFLACDALVQCNDPRIRSVAGAIVRGERDPWARALLIEAWVNRNLAKRTVLSLPSAVDVLATREGDCGEHTVLFTALARAAGIPTRMAAGLVWSDDLQAFAYHAWPEVFVGRWVWTDPTLGQPVADATHLKLATGGVADWQGIAVFLGRVRLDVLEVE